MLVTYHHHSRDCVHKCSFTYRVHMQCRFAKEAELSLPSTFHVYKLSHDMLDLIKGEIMEDAQSSCQLEFLLNSITKLEITQNRVFLQGSRPKRILICILHCFAPPGAGGASFEEAERQFKKLLLKLTIQQRKSDVPLLSALDCHKIAPFFTTT